MIDTSDLMLLFDLYWLRFRKSGQQWYELTDYLRGKLDEDGFEIRYTEDDLVFGRRDHRGRVDRMFSMKDFIDGDLAQR